MSALNHTRSNNLIDNMFNDLFNDAVFSQPYMGDSKRRTPLTLNRDEDWQIVFAIPGVKKDQVSIKVDDHVLTVSYDNKQKDDYFSFVSSFNRSWELDRGVDISKIVANHEDGILKITVPKPEAKKRVVRTIEVS
jgi:HSP20 family protein